MSELQPFHAAVPQADIDDLQARLARVRWPDELPGAYDLLVNAPLLKAFAFIAGPHHQRLKVNAFVATLGSASIFTGFAFLITASGAVFVTNPDFTYLGNEDWLGIPILIWILALSFVVGGLILSRSTFGRGVYIVGGNPDAARLSGMRVNLIISSTYAISALAAAFAGMLLASQTSVGQANVGTDVTLDAIAVVIIGGTSLRGGQGAMWRTVVGFLILAIIDSLFNSLAWSSASQSLAKGAIIIIAVALDSLSNRRR